MTGLLLVILRYLFLLLFYILLIWLFWYLVRELRAVGLRAPAGEPEAAGDRQPKTAARGPQLVLVEGSGGRRVFQVGVVARIGRGPENEVVISREDVSECHACIYLRNGQYWLEDLTLDGSTRLNGLPIDGPTVLADGDRVEVGGTTLLFERWRRAAGVGTV